MSGLGKDYRKGDPLHGAAILMLTLQKQGVSDDAVRGLLHGAFADLGVKEADVRKYLRKNIHELEAALAKQG